MEPSAEPSAEPSVNVTDNCRLEVHSIEALDWSTWKGLWIPWGGSMSNWGTHLGSEEYDPDARVMTLSYEESMKNYEYDIDGVSNAANIMNFIRYFAYYEIPDKSMESLNEIFNPYYYGHITEMSIDASSASQVAKWYTSLCIVRKPIFSFRL